MSNNKIEGVLHKLKAFKYLEPPHLAILAKLMTIKSFEEGQLQGHQNIIPS